MVSKRRRQIAIDNLEPDIARELTIPPLEGPDDFEGVIKAKDLPDLDMRDNRILLAVSIMEQRQFWIIDVLREQNRQLMNEETTRVREKLEQAAKIKALEESQQETSMGYKIVKWTGLCIGSAVIVTLIKMFFDNLK